MRGHILGLLIRFIGVSAAMVLVAVAIFLVVAPAPSTRHTLRALQALTDLSCRLQGQSESSYELEDGPELYVINSDGSNLKRLGTEGFDPRWSPDGKKLAFSWRTAGGPNPGIGVVNAAGTESKRLIAEGFAPSWSQDGSTIAFSTGGRVMLMRLEGEELRELGKGQQWSWSPDGKAIMSFWGNSVTRTDVKGGGIRKIASFRSMPGDANSWSPDGREITLISRARETSRYQEFRLHLLELETGTARILAEGFLDVSVAWSPDNRTIAFTSSDLNISVMNFDGTGRHQLGKGQYPVWSPDGKKIAFRVDHCDSEIYIMNADGSARIRLTYSRTNDDTPAWSPDGTRIAFTAQRGSTILKYLPPE